MYGVAGVTWCHHAKRPWQQAMCTELWYAGGTGGAVHSPAPSCALVAPDLPLCLAHAACKFTEHASAGVWRRGHEPQRRPCRCTDAGERSACHCRSTPTRIHGSQPLQPAFVWGSQPLLDAPRLDMLHLCQQSALHAAAALLRTQQLCLHSSPSFLAAHCAVCQQIGNRVPLPELHISDSSEAILLGRKPPFRLLVRPHVQPGSPQHVSGWRVYYSPVRFPCIVLGCTGMTHHLAWWLWVQHFGGRLCSKAQQVHCFGDSWCLGLPAHCSASGGSLSTPTLVC